MKPLFLLLSLFSFAVDAQSFKGTPDCEKEKLAEFTSVIIQKVQRSSGISTTETKIDLEKHYYPQMSRPNQIQVATKKNLKEVSLIHSNRQIEKIKLKKIAKDNYQFELPKLKKFKGKIQLVFEKNERCERSLILEEVSP